MCTYIHAYVGNLTGGSRSAYNDYRNGLYAVTIPAGETNNSFSVTIFDDSRTENIETFYLYIANIHTFPSYVITGTPADVTVTIVDNECKFHMCV